MTACKAQTELPRHAEALFLTDEADLEPAWLRAELGVPLMHRRNQLPEPQEKLPKVNIFSLVRDAIGMPLTSHMV